MVGKILVSSNTLNSRYQSNMTNLSTDNKTFPIQNYELTPGWNESGITIDPSVATSALQKAMDFLSSFYNRSKVRNNLLNQNGNDWLLDGDQFSPKTTTLSEKASKAAVIDGPWMISTYSSIYDKAIAIPNLTEEGVPYVQAPGGWLYAINQRNSTNEVKIRDMKRFLNILLTDEEVIMAQYKQAGKIIEGSFAKTLLEEYANDSQTPKLEASVLKAIYSSESMDQRPDGGNADFNLVWSRWDENGFRSPSIKNMLVGWDTRNLSDAEVSRRLKEALSTSFDAMLRGLQSK